MEQCSISCIKIQTCIFVALSCAFGQKKSTSQLINTVPSLFAGVSLPPISRLSGKVLSRKLQLPAYLESVGLKLHFQ